MAISRPPCHPELSIVSDPPRRPPVVPCTTSRPASPPPLLNNGQAAESVQEGSARRRTAAVEAASAPSDCRWGLVVLAAAFLIHCIVEGISYSFVVFYVDLLDEFSSSQTKVVLVGTLLPATSLFVGPVVGGFTDKFGCRSVTVCGSVLAAASVAVSFLSHRIDLIVITYGLLAGIGFGMMRLPSIVIVSYYFRHQRALATSVVLSGSGVGYLLIVPLSRYLNHIYGWRGANALLAAVVLHGAVCGLLFRPPPVPVARTPSPSPRQSCAVMDQIIAEKRRRRCESTGSLDGTLITSDGQLLRQQTQLNSTLPLSGGPSSRPRTVSMSTESSVRSSLLAGGEGQSTVGRSHHQTSRPQSSSTDNSDRTRTFSELLTTVPDLEVVDEQSRRQSDISDSDAVVWVRDSGGHPARCSCSDMQLSETSGRSTLVEMRDLGVARGEPRPSSSTSRPSTLPGPSSSRPDVYLQVNEDAASSSDGGKMVSAHAQDGRIWSVMRGVLGMFVVQRVTFLVLAVSILLCYLGLMTPFTHLVSHAEVVGVTRTQATTLLTVLLVSSGVGRLVVGWLADRPWVDSVVLYTVALLVAGAGTCSLPLLSTYQLLCVYQIVYGTCCAVFTLKSILVVDLIGLDKLATAYGILSLLEGVGSLAGTPLIGSLYVVTQSYAWSFVVSGIVLLVAGAVSVPLRRLQRWEVWKTKRRLTVQHGPLIVVRNAL